MGLSNRRAKDDTVTVLKVLLSNYEEVMDHSMTPYSNPRGAAVRPNDLNRRIADVEALARWMDYAFSLPGGFRFGFAGFIDLIPGIGDILDALLSVYIVARAVQLGVPRVTLTRMVVNVGLEALAGAVPFLGAIFDTVFKANRRNYLLLREHLEGNRRQTAKDWLFLVAVGLIAFLSVAVPIIVLWELLKRI